ncbi:TetR/AcrR family transcriptional regulator [Geopsychrobacter electrodiphilus]|uniref:TetR/AcrR family transcriptional regulator n=1 Tax=Geopsychrobacter electrodiphilus TaxID=225196 RepID=UPI000360BED2|nr:TetR/AcrR family transcriptional regulator [Geopsychrobacter electrodiphilus]
MTPFDTKTRLLDAAESLFSNHGFAGTSMRTITTMANANLAAANYHFGHKEDLLRAVLERRLLPLNQIRNQRIDKVIADAAAANRRPGAEDLLRAFIEPTMALRHSESGSTEFVLMIGRSLTAADPAVRDRFLELTRPLIKKLHQALCLALPQLPAELLFTRLFFTMGAMGHCLCFAGITHLFGIDTGCDHPNEDRLAQNLISFVTSGLEAPC